MNKLFINILVLCFVLLFLYNMYIANANRKVVEHMDNNDDSDDSDDYKDYKDDPLILAQQNAGNIKVLNKQVEKAMNIIGKMQPKQNTMQTQIDSNTNSVGTLINAQQNSANSASGMDSDPTPDSLTGLD